MAEKKERIKIVEVIRSTSSTKVTFSNGLKISLGAGDLEIFNDYGFVNAFTQEFESAETIYTPDFKDTNSDFNY